MKPVVLNRNKDFIPEDSVYVGRGSKWGNPHRISKDLTRKQCIAKYERSLTSNQALMAALKELEGKNLVCWCAPKRCHADVLLRLANQRSLCSQDNHA